MNDAQITVVGNVAAEPRYIVTRNGTPLLSLRLASTPRRFDRETGQWRDGDTMFMTVTCWRSLAVNGQESLSKGDPVVVTGRLRLREYDRDGERRLSAEIEATTVGHDLSRGVARFDRVRRAAGTTSEDRREAARLADIWVADEAGGAEDGDRDAEARDAEAGEPAATAEGADVADGAPDTHGAGADDDAARAEPGDEAAVEDRSAAMPAAA